MTEIDQEREESLGAEVEKGESPDPSPERDTRNIREIEAEIDTAEIDTAETGAGPETDIIGEMTDTEIEMIETTQMICAGTRKTPLAARNTAEDLAVVDVNYNMFCLELICVVFSLTRENKVMKQWN